MKSRRLSTLLGLLVLPQCQAAVCSTSTAVTSSSAYVSCSAATGIDFTDKNANKKSSFSTSVFCSNADCAMLWELVDSRGELTCFHSYDAGQAKISDRTYTTNCFISAGLRTRAPTAAAPTKKPTPSNNAGGNSVNAIAGANANANVNANINIYTDTNTNANTNSGTALVHNSGASSDSDTEAAGTTRPDITSTTASSASMAQEKDKASKGADEITGSQYRKPASSQGDDESSIKPDPSMGAGSLTSLTSGSRSFQSVKTARSQEGSSDSSGDKSDATGNGPSPAWVASGGSSGGVVLVIVLFLYFRKRKANVIDAKKDNEADPIDYLPTLDSSRSHSDSISALGAGSGASNRSLPSSRFAFWDDEVINAVRIPYEKLEVGALLSRGGYGEVYKGTYRGQLVAIKSLLPERRKDMRQIEKFLDEVKLMAVLDHEHIVRFVGVAWDSLNELCVVSEFMARGDLRSLLAQYEANEHLHPKGFDSDKTKIALHIANALTYMHSLLQAVLHRDLKSRNILLDAELNAKLTDFGISRERADTTMTVGVGSSLWMAPEVMVGGRYDDKADVFSFGVVLSELDTQMLPYSHALEPDTNRKLPDAVVVQMMTTGRLSVLFTNEHTSPLARLGRRCVALDPAERPSAAEVQHHIHQLWRHPDDSL